MAYYIDKIRIFLCFLFLLLEGLSDLKKKKILIPPVFVFFVSGALLSIFQGKADFISSLAGAAVGGMVLFVAYITKEKIGFGDGLVLLSTGALLGVRLNVLMLLLGLFIAALKGIWILISRNGGKNTEMPFVPYLIPGLTLSLALVTGSGY